MLKAKIRRYAIFTAQDIRRLVFQKNFIHTIDTVEMEAWNALNKVYNITLRFILGNNKDSN